MKRGGALLLLVFLFGLSPWVQADLQAQPSCKKQWSKLIPKNQHKYNYAEEAQLTKKGNEGYLSWWRRTERAYCEKEWTFLIYQFADNDLSPFALADLYEIEAGFKVDHRAASTLKTDVIVEFDGIGEEGVRRYHMFESPVVHDPNRSVEDFKKMQPHEIKSPIVKWLDETKMGTHEERLTAFLRWGVRNYPAKNYAVVLWGHGQGWTAIPPKKVVSSTFKDWKLFPDLAELSPVTGGDWDNARPYGGLAFDEGRDSYLDIPALKRALKGVQDSELQGRPFDMYISDACLMQQIEVASELVDQTRFVVGSPQVQNYLGLPYRTFFYQFNSGSHLGFRKKVYGKNYRGKVDEALLAAYLLPELMATSLAQGGLQWKLDRKGKKSFSLSSLSTHAIKYGLRDSIEELAKKLNDYLYVRPLMAFEIQFAFNKSISFGPGMKDFGTFLDLLHQLIKQEALIEGEMPPEADELNEQLTEVWLALRLAVINKSLGERYKEVQAYPSFSGLGIWLPASQRDYRERVVDLSQSQFFRSSQSKDGLSAWGQFLQRVFAPLDEN